MFPYVVTLVAAGLLIEYAPFACIWAAVLLVLVCGWSFRRAQATSAKMLWLNVAVVFAFLGVHETYLTLRYEPDLSYDNSRGYRGEGYFERHADLGYRAKASSRVAVSRQVDGETVYDVVYTIDADGLRVSPPVRSDGRTTGCIWFFGGSYMFGEGVEDDEAMPWRVGIKTHGDYIIRNFGFHGYGPHQMLAELQTGLTLDRAGCEPTHVIYQGIVWHAPRVAGLSVWDREGPRFVIDDQGGVRRDGTFADIDFGGPPEWLLVRLARSKIYVEHFEKYVNPKKRRVNEDDVLLMVAIIEESAREIGRRFPEAAFHMLLWDVTRSALLDTAERALAKGGIAVHAISDAVPDYRPACYVFHRYETHPNARAHDEIADYVVSDILRYGR